MKENDKRINNGRPFKMEAWTRELVIILENENVIFLSDIDLVFLVNRNLPDNCKISERTFKRWKAGLFQPNEEIGKEFMGCIELALIRQKQNLGEKLLNDKTGYWTRFAWILERKFSEFNLKHISENINKNEQATTINITAGSSEQKKLIEDIINADFIEIKPEALAIPLKKEVEQTDNTEDDELPF